MQNSSKESDVFSKSAPRALKNTRLENDMTGSSVLIDLSEQKTRDGSVILINESDENVNF